MSQYISDWTHLVVSECHDALRAGDLEARLGAVEEPPEGVRLGLGVHLAPQVDALRAVLKQVITTCTHKGASEDL